jgi:two-component system nitrogen regulation response regulator NtrX
VNGRDYSMKPNLLVVDDEEGILTFFKEYLSKQGFAVYTARNWSRAEKILYSTPLDVVFLDLQLPGKNGMEILKDLKSTFPLLEIILFSGKANIEIAVEAIKEGAFDFVEKSDSLEKVLTVIENALKIKKLKEENIFLKKIKKGTPEKDLIGVSPAIQQIKEDIIIAANNDANVLITGENGTGKQVVAELIHQHSERNQESFVDINCAAIPENLLESELFGYEKGAFTGAYSTTSGKIESAQDGSLFLDEIGEMPMGLQAKLLKVLESKVFRRVGGKEPIHFNAKIITATNVDIEREIREKRFRKDLFYRLNVIHVHLPPLRERVQDIPLLIIHFLERFGKKGKVFSKEAIDFLKTYQWPGNVRELRNIVERSVIMTHNKKTIEQQDLENYLHPGIARKKEGELIPLREYLQKEEKQYLIQALNRFQTQKEAAEALNIERTVLYRKLKKYNIKI